MISRKQFLGATVASLASPLAFSQAGKPVEWVVGYAAGGGSDVVARTIAEAMARTLGRPIFVSNKPGAGTNIAAEYTVRSKAYGDILFTADFATLAANPFLFAKLSYDAKRDFQPIGLLVRFPMFLVVGSAVPAGNLNEFSAWARAQKDGASWGSAGLGSPHHLIGELFRQKTGLPLQHVPYRGAAPAIQDVAGGQIPAMWVDSATAYPFLAGKKIRAIGVASAARAPTAADVPTMNEQGLKGFEGYAWQGLVVPTGTPAEATAGFAKALQDALGTTAVKARLQALGVEPMPGTSAQMASFVAAERSKWGELIAAAGIKLD